MAFSRPTARPSDASGAAGDRALLPDGSLLVKRGWLRDAPVDGRGVLARVSHRQDAADRDAARPRVVVLANRPYPQLLPGVFFRRLDYFAAPHPNAGGVALRLASSANERGSTSSSPGPDLAPEQLDVLAFTLWTPGSFSRGAVLRVSGDDEEPYHFRAGAEAAARLDAMSAGLTALGTVEMVATDDSRSPWGRNHFSAWTFEGWAEWTDHRDEMVRTTSMVYNAVPPPPTIDRIAGSVPRTALQIATPLIDRVVFAERLFILSLPETETERLSVREFRQLDGRWVEPGRMRDGLAGVVVYPEGLDGEGYPRAAQRLRLFEDGYRMRDVLEVPWSPDNARLLRELLRLPPRLVRSALSELGGHEWRGLLESVEDEDVRRWLAEQASVLAVPSPGTGTETGGGGGGEAASGRLGRDALPLDVVYENTRRTAADVRDLLQTLSGNARLPASAVRDIPSGGGGLTQSEVDARVVAGVLGTALAGNADRWAKAKLPSDTVYTGDLPAAPTLSSLGGLTQSQVDGRVTFGTLAEARRGSAGRWSASKLPADVVYTNTTSYATALTKLGTIERNAKDDQTGPEIVVLLSDLAGAARLPYSAVKDAPNIPTLPPVMSQSEAEEGTVSATRLTTPERQAQAIAALAPTGGSGGGGGSGGFVVYNRPGATAINTSSAGAWSAWTDVGVTSAMSASRTGNVLVVGSAVVEVDGGTGGGDRGLMRLRLVRTRSSVDTVIQETPVYGPRNVANASTSTFNVASRRGGGYVMWRDVAESGDVYKLQVQIMAQRADAHTWTFDVDNTGVFAAGLGDGLTQADVDNRIIATARVGDAGRWAKNKLPSDTVYTGDLPAAPTLSSLGGLTQSEVDGRIIPTARTGNTGTWPKNKLPTDLVYTNTTAYSTALTKLGTVEENAKDDQTGAEMVTAISGLSGNARLSYNNLKDTPSVPTLASLGGLTQTQVDQRVSAGTLAAARAGNTTRWAASKLPGDVVYATTIAYSAALTKLATIEENAKDDQTGPEIVTLLSGLSGNARLSYTDLKDAPNIPTLPPVMTQAEAEEGTVSATRLTTPERQAQAIAALATSTGGGGGGGSGGFVVYNRPSATAINTAGAGVWTGWTDVGTTSAMSSTRIGNALIIGVADIEVNTGQGGGDRGLVQLRLVRTRSSVDTVIQELQLYGPRNVANASTTTFNQASRRGGGVVLWRDSAEAGDVYKMQARVMAQHAQARTWTFSAAGTGVTVAGLGDGLTTADVTNLILAAARAGSSVRWGKSKLPADVVYTTTTAYSTALTKLGTVEENAKDDQTGPEIATLLSGLSGNARLSYNNLKDTPTIPTLAGLGGLTQSEVDNRVTAGTLAEARAGNTDRWPANKVPTLATLGGQTQDQVDDRIEAGAIRKWTGTRAQYDALAAKDGATLYLVTG